jgi:hypothetical protein
MQQRFCACGCAIWVQYLFPNMNCQTFFITARDSENAYLADCPCCGKKLSIDVLK